MSENFKPNSEFDAHKHDYQEIVANMESVVDGIQDSDWITPRDKFRLMHAKEGLVTEAGELADAFKRHIYYRQPLDRTNIIEELGDVMWYVGLACNVLGITIRDIQIANICKLQKRYPEKFTVDRATNRNTEVEMEALSGSLRSEGFMAPRISGEDVTGGAPQQLSDPEDAQEGVSLASGATQNVVFGLGSIWKHRASGCKGKVAGRANGGQTSGLSWNNNWFALINMDNGEERKINHENEVDAWDLVD